MTRSPEVYEVIVELGGRSFAGDNRWRIAAGIVLLLIAALCVANVRDALGWAQGVAYVLGATTAAVLIIVIAATATEISGPRQQLQAEAITKASGYTFLAGRPLLDSGDPFQNEPVLVTRDGVVARCVLSAWRLHSKTGEWQAELSKNWRHNTRTQKLQLECPQRTAGS
ncbi:hypothetical protein ACFO5K_22450 [Nocardia halotolerans]|uniref:Uncharacterized protein n=1 Tax=Nocardia halotolerans TaxID=1755878 RepID=A0ABV8VPS8_9NOCA